MEREAAPDAAIMPSILVADDEASLREFLVRGLGLAGYRVVSVADGSEALAALGKASYDLLITDIVMPKLDGIALALKVSKDYPDTKILMMTGYAHERMRAHNLDCLSHQVISKPFTLKQMLAIVAGVVRAPQGETG
jgi:DNA-binding response OmpR family regulator